MKSIQNLKVLKARSPNFKNFGKLSTIRKEMNEIWKKLNEINQVHGSSIWPSQPLIDEENILNKQTFTDVINGIASTTRKMCMWTKKITLNTVYYVQKKD